MNNYFGGYGSGKGWYSIPFFITTEDLKLIFDKYDFHLIISNRRVKLQYNETKKEDYLGKYKEFIENLKISSKINKSIEDDLYISLTKNMGKIKWVPSKDTNFKLLNAQEPVIDVRPLSVYYGISGDKDFLSVDTYGEKEKLINFGLIIYFPKVISYTDEKYKIIYNTKKYSNFQLYQELFQDINKITKPLIIKSQFKERKTKVRISEECKNILNKTKFFKKNGLVAK
jgi:hypothetical protein